MPELTGEDDTGYYDDFTSPQDMEKYAEVIEKQRHVERVRGRSKGSQREEASAWRDEDGADAEGLSTRTSWGR